jgi:hypothetical protein
MPALTVELVDLISPENIGNYLAVNQVVVPVQTSERDRDRTYKLDLGAMYRSLIDYVDSARAMSAADHTTIWANDSPGFGEYGDTYISTRNIAERIIINAPQGLFVNGIKI